MLLEFRRLKGSRSHVADRNGRVYLVVRQGPKQYRAEVVRLSHQIVGTVRTCRSLAAAKAWLEDEAETIARKERLAVSRTPIVSAIEKGRS